MSKFPSQEMDRFNVRLPAGMRDAIADRAKRNGRSMNSEIVDIISSALSQPALAQEGIEYLLGLAEEGEAEKLSKNDRDRARSLVLDAAAIMAHRLESESKDLRILLYLASKDSPLKESEDLN
ncbi:TPA: Arc family DNA-binding protein [Enterobacter kobei]|uniref:Arc-like DNA binding domain-containing protein n=1 Tax=Enterobacter cloacae TaxID=550 RepID=A0A6S5K8K4_ENTCL|nr:MULTISPECIES: Arc family DNA-binding protein [Enterobacteriaceae]MCL8105653.1 Arc family DNA-binding protein [Enterobacter hormaechei]MCM8292578.1 Arc family DNA-binding protein [Enterobacter hormaechei]MCM8496114.1 Arc family DNA-binding protein [Enterobacter hormaechei]MCM8501151.1 Arc family DNA-binding protein [Enterobacter hormaechei]MCM8506027.1 Arc family DNA-binding protein [Enterobacter hormaechei]